MKKRIAYCIIILAFTSGCSDDGLGFSIFSNSSDFSTGPQGWVGDFADYPTGIDDSSFYELRFEYTDRPENLGPVQKAIMLSGNNHSDDLFMFLKKKINGLQPNTDYTVVFEVELASNAEKNNTGVGGAPGESVYVKAGASIIEPKKIVDGNNYRMNIDKGNQSTDGDDMKVIGNIAVESAEYNLITRSNSSQSTPFIVRSSALGELWLIVGTDSGFEGVTTLYYTKINVVFSSSN
ncbi:MAG: hypothetical protein ABI663_00190 [Chryseolinea sp.]